MFLTQQRLREVYLNVKGSLGHIAINCLPKKFLKMNTTQSSLSYTIESTQNMNASLCP
jgi:hypothetical protein